jgi:hypothetical protein
MLGQTSLSYIRNDVPGKSSKVSTGVTKENSGVSWGNINKDMVFGQGEHAIMFRDMVGGLVEEFVH